MKADEVATLIAESSQSIEDKLSWHFSNFRTKVPEQMQIICRDVIHMANSGEDLDTVFILPEGVERHGGNKATANDIIIGFHLSYFIKGGK
jgi:hypothetical protein